MKFAIPSDDGQTIGRNAGRSVGFIIYDLYGEIFERVDFRKVPSAYLARVEETLRASPDHEERGIDFEPVLTMLADCQVVVSIGMSPWLMVKLNRSGIETVFTLEGNADEVAQQFADGSLNVLDPGQLERYTRRVRKEEIAHSRHPAGAQAKKADDAQTSPW